MKNEQWKRKNSGQVNMLAREELLTFSSLIILCNPGNGSSLSFGNRALSVNIKNYIAIEQKKDGYQ
jgi:hypothetical protein